MNPTRRIRPSRSLAGVHPHQQRVLAPIADVQPLRCGELIEVNRVNLHRLIYVTATRIQQSNYAVRTELSVRTPHMAHAFDHQADINGINALHSHSALGHLIGGRAVLKTNNLGSAVEHRPVILPERLSVLAL